MKKLLSFTLILAIFSIGIFSCVDKDPNFHLNPEALILPENAFDYESIDIPNTILNGSAINIISTNNIEQFSSFGRINDNPAVTNDGATLGRVLFYDKHLSLNNSVSCGSCHNQARAFADPLALSVGFEGRKTTRNSMAIINPGLNNSLFWDSRSRSVRSMSLEPVKNHIEMGMESMAVLKNKLAQLEYYPELFEKAYGSPVINEENISDAISQFLVSMITFDSKFDQGIDNNFENFTTIERQGMHLFQQHCSGCHGNESFGAADSFGGDYQQSEGTANIGLDLNYTDKGRGDGKFKIPALRNVVLTSPYMHDGRFNSLDEVIEHYNSGVQNHPKLDSKLKNGNSPKRLNLDPFQKQALIAFLNTLTDESYVTDEKYSNPFK